MSTDGTAAKDEVELYTDGACSGNPGPGGWAYILSHPSTGQTREAAGAELQTTNNRMELTAAIRGLESLTRRCRVKLVTDSQYVARGITDWMPQWKARGWQRKEKGRLKPVLNVDLWQELDALLQRHDVRVEAVLGHTGHPENEACDRMAVAAYKAMMADQRMSR